MLLAQYASDGDKSSLNTASQLLQRLQVAAVAGDRTGSVIEILVLQALIHQARGDVSAAVDAAERALTLAEPRGLRADLRR